MNGGVHPECGFRGFPMFGDFPFGILRTFQLARFERFQDFLFFGIEIIHWFHPRICRRSGTVKRPKIPHFPVHLFQRFDGLQEFLFFRFRPNSHEMIQRMADWRAAGTVIQFSIGSRRLIRRFPLRKRFAFHHRFIPVGKSRAGVFCPWFGHRTNPSLSIKREVIRFSQGYAMQVPFVKTENK
ncbi:MAG: hypothetical protein ACLFRG_23060 [Desulfococcaceae bacterium]